MSFSSHFKFILKFAVCICLLLPIKGYTQPQEKLFVIVLVDETGSFVDKTGSISYWKKSIPIVTNVIINDLRAGEAFSLIGIDNNGLDPEDIRVEPRTMRSAVLFEGIDRKKLRENLSKLQARLQAQRTDIIGALGQAAYLLKHMPGYQGVIFIFSDMEHNYYNSSNKKHTLEEEAKIRDFQFPNGTRCYCFYIKEDMKKELMRRWAPIFDMVNLNVSGEFYPDDIPLKGIIKNLRQQFK